MRPHGNLAARIERAYGNEMHDVRPANLPRKAGPTAEGRNRMTLTLTLTQRIVDLFDADR